MKKTSASRQKPSLRALAWMRSLRVSWTRWSLKRLKKRLIREQRRLQLMLEQLDLQHLRLKQLEILEAVTQDKLRQMEWIRNYRLKGELEPPPPKSELDQELGL